MCGSSKTLFRLVRPSSYKNFFQELLREVGTSLVDFCAAVLNHVLDFVDPPPSYKNFFQELLREVGTSLVDFCAAVLNHFLDLLDPP